MFIVGAGQAAYEKRADRPVQRVLWEALDAALQSAGLAMRDVDGLAATAFVLPPDNVTTLAEHFGLAPRWLFQGLYGGASGVVSVLHAARAIQAGDADVVACIAADVFDTAAHDNMLDHFNGSVRGLHGAVRLRRGERKPSPYTPGSTWRSTVRRAPTSGVFAWRNARMRCSTPTRCSRSR